MRKPSFYDVVNTLDRMNVQMDIAIEANPKTIIKRITPALIKDLANIIGADGIVAQMMINPPRHGFNRQHFNTFGTTTSRKWGDFKNPNDPQVRKFMLELDGIYKLHKIDVFTISRENKEFRNLEKQLPSQRRLVLSDETYKNIERYMFFLEGYNNVFMNMLVGEGTLDINTVLTTEQKSQYANFKNVKNVVLAGLLKDITISIDDFIKSSK
jgi:hypothetical protein